MYTMNDFIVRFASFQLILKILKTCSKISASQGEDLFVVVKWHNPLQSDDFRYLFPTETSQPAASKITTQQATHFTSKWHFHNRPALEKRLDICQL